MLVFGNQAFTQQILIWYQLQLWQGDSSPCRGGKAEGREASFPGARGGGQRGDTDPKRVKQLCEATGITELN